MSDLTPTQMLHAEDIAKGMVLAQLRKRPDVGIRGMLESGVIQNLPHEQKLQTLRHYADLENQEPYRNQINTLPSGPRAFASGTAEVTSTALKTGLLGGALKLLSDPVVAASVIQDRGAKVRAFKALRTPMMIAGAAGGILAGARSLQDYSTKRDYVAGVQDTLEEIRNKDNDNPYLNAMILTNAQAIKNTKLDRESIEDNEQTMAQMMQDSVAIGSILSPNTVQNPALLNDVVSLALSNVTG